MSGTGVQRAIFVFSNVFFYDNLLDAACVWIPLRVRSQKLLTTCGVHDFSLQDIIAPQHKRLIKILSAIINFAKYREDKIEGWVDGWTCRLRVMSVVLVL